MLRSLMDEIDSMQAQMGRVSRDGNRKKGLKTTTNAVTDTEMRNAFDGLVAGWAWLRVASLRQRLCRWNPQKRRSREKKD